MKKHRVLIPTLLTLSMITAMLSADTHITIKSKRNLFGNEKTSRIEVWIGPDKQYQDNSEKIDIFREDLGVRWILDPSKKTYLEIPLNSEVDIIAGGVPNPPEKGGDLRFAGMFVQPEFEWKQIDTANQRNIKGLICREYKLIGDSDYSHLEISLWISNKGKKELNLVKSIMKEYRRFFNADLEIFRLMERFPEGGIAEVNVVMEPSIGSEMLFSIEIETREETAPPENIYDIPEGYTKGK